MKDSDHLPQLEACRGAGSGAGLAPGGVAGRRAGGGSRLVAAWHRVHNSIRRGKRTRLLLLPSVMAFLAPVVLAATLPVFLVTIRGIRTIRSVDGLMQTLVLCAGGSGAGSSGNGLPDCSKYKSLLDVAPSVDGHSFAKDPDTIFVRTWLQASPNDPGQIRVSMVFEPTGRFASQRRRQLNLPPDQTLNLNVGIQDGLQDQPTFSIQGGLLMPVLTYDVFQMPGLASVAYPEDHAAVALVLQISLQLPGPGNTTLARAVPVVWQLASGMMMWDAAEARDQSYGFVAPGPGGGSSTVMSMALMLTRSKSVKSLVWLIFSLMWVISIAMLAAAIDIVFISPRPVDSGDVGVAVGLLFALPAIRTIMPDGPPLGSPLDTCGSIWNISLVLVASLMLMAAWLGQLEQLPEGASEGG